MEGYEEYAINSNALYEFTVTNDASYSNIQSNFAINDILYNDQSELGVIRAFYMAMIKIIVKLEIL